jgi:DNA-binding CsgD family transcriptional regulator
VPEIGVDARKAVDALRAGRVTEAFAAVARVSTAFSAMKPDAVAAAPVNALLVGGAQLAHERLPAAVHTLDRGLTAVKDSDQRPLVAALAMTRAVALSPMLRLEQATRDLDTAAAAWAEMGAQEHRLVTLVQQAVVADLRGDPDATGPAIRRARDLLVTLPDSEIKRGRECRLAALECAADPERCIDDILRAGGDDLAILDPTSAVQLMGVLVLACLAAGRRADAERWAAHMSRRAATCGLPLGRARARLARAALLLASGDGAGAAELALRAAETAERLGSVADGLGARLLAARGLQHGGVEREAVEQLEIIVETFHQADGMRADAISVLRDLGVTVYDAPADPASRFERLTMPERHVMDLVLAGHSTEQVAIQASLTEGAVERHLSAVLNKVGARTRGELAAFAARLQSE